MRIAWYGHACFEVGDENTNIVIDPHDGKSIGIKPPYVKGDVVLVSHNHFDHNATRVVSKPDSLLITMPEEAGRLDNYNLKMIPAHHDDVHGMRRGDINMFLFSMGGVNLCHVGDLGHVLGDEQLEQFDRSVDILFLPVGGHFTINYEEALTVTSQLKPKVVIPMHYSIGGLSLNISPVDPFLKNFEQINRVGNEIDFFGEELNDIEDIEIWLFSL